MVALQALSKFASRIHGDGLDVTVNVATGSGDGLDFHVTGENSILLQQQSYSKPDLDVHITAKGDGCILLQVKCAALFNPFPNRHFEAVDNNWNMADIGFLDTDYIEKIVEKGEIAHFFHNVFLSFFFNVLE